MLKYLKIILFTSLSLLAVACSEPSLEPVSGQLSFKIGNNSYADNISFVSQGGVAYLTEFQDTEIYLRLLLNNTSLDPISSGKVISFDPNNPPDNRLQIIFLDDAGQRDPERIYWISSGEITVDAYSATDSLISFSFSNVMELTTDTESQISVEGTAIDIPLR